MSKPRTIEEVVKSVDHLKTAENPEGNPFFHNNLSVDEALKAIEDIISAAIEGQEIDIEATEKHIESTGVNGDELEMAIVSARLDCDDRHDTLNDVRKALSEVMRSAS